MAALQRVGSPDEADVIVSLTTYPARLNGALETLSCILRQDRRPDAVVLVLSCQQFDQVPDQLRPFQALGVSVLFDTGDIRSYKKLLPVLSSYPGRVVVTADDDVYYPRDWLARLLRVSAEYPDDIVGHRGSEVLIDNERPLPYLSWPRATYATHERRIFLTGMGGILYPPQSLHPDVLDRDAARRLCPTGDDIWFKAMALRSGSRTRLVSDVQRDFDSVRSSQSTALVAGNVHGGANDRQLSAVLNEFPDVRRALVEVDATGHHGMGI